MKVPKTLQIGGHAWTIRLVKQSEMEHEHAGECHFEKNEIRILKDLTKEQIQRVLLHEIRHAHQWETGMTQVLQAQTMEMDSESFVSLVLSLKKQKVI